MSDDGPAIAGRYRKTVALHEALSVGGDFEETTVRHLHDTLVEQVGALDAGAPVQRAATVTRGSMTRRAEYLEAVFAAGEDFLRHVERIRDVTEEVAPGIKSVALPKLTSR